MPHLKGGKFHGFVLDAFMLFIPPVVSCLSVLCGVCYVHPAFKESSIYLVLCKHVLEALFCSYVSWSVTNQRE